MIHASLRAVADPGSRAADTARLDGSTGFDGTAMRIDDMRAEALWKTASWRAGLSLVCLAICGWAMAATAPGPWLALWAAVLIAFNIAGLRAHRRAAHYPLGTIGRSNLWVVGEASLHALMWALLPALMFAGQPLETQMLVTAAMATMIAGAFLLALAPVAAVLWALILTAGLMHGLHLAGGPGTSVLLLLLGAYLAVILTGCLTVERLVSGYMESAMRERLRRDAITQLLREYEERGAGWLWQIDATGVFSYVSPRLSHMLGRGTSQLVGQHVPAVFGLDARLGGAIAARDHFDGLELQVPTPSGPRWVSLSGGPIFDPAGAFQGYRGVGTDVTDRRRAEERLARLAANDVLTGLPNRHSLGEILNEALARWRDAGAPCAMFYLDLDGFKPVNDTFGHPVGDAVLRAVARRLSDVVGDRGQVGRVGGDEFALVLCDGASRAEAEALGRSMIAAVSQPYRFDGCEVRIGVSIGCAFAPDDGVTGEELLLKADTALYEAKAQGRGAFRAFDPAMQRAEEARRRLEDELRCAIAERQLTLLYQPIVDARTTAIQGFEALVRWQHPERGLIAPAEFLPAAEEAGLMPEIGAWVIGTACRDAATWPEPLFVSVNVCPRELIMPGLANIVGEALARARLAPERLELEVSEQRLAADAQGTLEVLRRLRGLGIRLALDDFGTGRSALGHLSSRLFDTLKIDGQCVRKAGEQEETLSMVRAIVGVAGILKMNVVAEGVERRPDFARMGAIGCHQIQGFLSGAPVPYDRATEMVGLRRALGALPA